MKKFISENVQKDKESAQLYQKKKAKNQQHQAAPILADEEIFLYKNLPFQAGDIADFYPTLKKLDISNRDAA